MKKFNEILGEINKLYVEVEEAKRLQEAEIERYYSAFEGLSFKERVIKKKEDEEAEKQHMQKITQYSSIITDGKIKLKLLQNNAKISLFNEVMPTVLSVYAKYIGKAYGEKTKEKISKEIKEKTDCRVYMNSGSFSVYPTFASLYQFECGTRYIDGDKKPLLKDNKIQSVIMEDLELYYINRIYFDDLEATIKELKRLHEEAKKKQEELKEICSRFNELSVDGIKDLRHTEYSFGNII